MRIKCFDRATCLLLWTWTPHRDYPAPVSERLQDGQAPPPAVAAPNQLVLCVTERHRPRIALSSAAEHSVVSSAATSETLNERRQVVLFLNSYQNSPLRFAWMKRRTFCISGCWQWKVVRTFARLQTVYLSPRSFIYPPTQSVIHARGTIPQFFDALLLNSHLPYLVELPKQSYITSIFTDSPVFRGHCGRVFGKQVESFVFHFSHLCRAGPGQMGLGPVVGAARPDASALESGSYPDLRSTVAGEELNELSVGDLVHGAIPERFKLHSAVGNSRNQVTSQTTSLKLRNRLRNSRELPSSSLWSSAWLRSCSLPFWRRRGSWVCRALATPVRGIVIEPCAPTSTCVASSVPIVSVTFCHLSVSLL